MGLTPETADPRGAEVCTGVWLNQTSPDFCILTVKEATSGDDTLTVLNTLVGAVNALGPDQRLNLVLDILHFSNKDAIAKLGGTIKVILDMKEELGCFNKIDMRVATTDGMATMMMNNLNRFNGFPIIVTHVGRTLEGAINPPSKTPSE